MQEERPVLMSEKLIDFKLHHYATKLGSEILSLTPDQALELAIQAEGFKNDMDPLDPHRLHFANQERAWTEIASLLEKKVAYVKASLAMVEPTHEG